MDGARSAMVGEYHGRSGSSGSTSSASASAKYATQLQKRQRLEQIASGLAEEPSRTRNPLSSSRSSGNSQRSTKSASKTSGGRRQTSLSHSRSKDEKMGAIKIRSKNMDDDEGTSIKTERQQQCIVCKRTVRNTRDLKHCFKCKKCSHSTCNSGFVQLTALNLYACPDCLKKEKINLPLSTGNNNTPVLNSNSIDEDDLAAFMDDGLNRPSCSQSVHSSDEDLSAGQIRSFASLKSVQGVGMNDDFSSSKLQGRKSGRRQRTRSSPQQQLSTAARSNSSASEEQSSPVGSKPAKTRISGSPSSSSIGISMTTAEPSNEARSPSEVSLSPESILDASSSRANLTESSLDHQTLKQPAHRSRRGEGGNTRGRGASQKKPTSTNRGGSTMRTRFGGKPTPSVTQVANIYSAYERSGKYERNRGRKNGKGKTTGSGGSRGRRGKVISAIVKSRGRQAQTSNYGQYSTDDKFGDSQGRLRSHDENDYVRTAIVTSANDKFMDSVSLCLICGSVGQDAEGAMLTCASCSQSYHIFCINSKPNSTILERGWRCLDCTVCEGCGTDKDESNLLLCDECDISYHIYCLEPKLTQIPNGPWRCKWCATCCRCKKQVQSGLDLLTLEGFCETCYSLRKCSKCSALYEAGDLLVKCQHCIRWFHARCEDLMTEEQVENASENAFRCTFCRPKINSSYENSSLIMDNVMISRNTLDHVSTLRRSNINVPFNDNSFRSISIDNDDYDNEDGNDPPYSRGGGRGRGGPGRRVLKLGIGGFHVRTPRQRPPANTADEKDKELTFPNVGGDEEEQTSAAHTIPGKRMRRPRRPRRPKLEDAYPPAIQEAFFGIHPVDSRSLMDVVVEEPVLGEHYNVKMEDKNRNLGCELSDQAADEIQVDYLGLLDILKDDDMGIDITDLSLFMDDNDDLNAVTATQFGGAYNSGLSDLANPFGDDKNIQFGIGSVDGNFITDEQNDDTNVNEEDSDLTSEQFHAQMEQNHEKQRQIQQQARLQLGSSNNQPNNQNAGESGTKSSNNLSNAEKINQATEKWEEDEPLGDKATKAAVLFANIEHDYLKEKFPQWADRVKRINNLWRKLSPQDREVYVKKARENRADVPKRRNKRATTSTNNSSGRVNGSMEDLGDASQDSNHSHLDNTLDQHNGQRSAALPVESRSHTEQPVYPNSTGVPETQPYKVPNPTETQINGMRPTPDVKIPVQRPDVATPKDGRAASQSQEQRPPAQAPMMSTAEWERYNVLREQHIRINDQRSKIDEDLTKLRKIKKNSKAKVRSLSIKSEQINDSQIRNDIFENQSRVDAVSQEITEKQRIMDRCKHDLKEVMAQLQSFESRYHINPMPPPTNNVAALTPDPHSQVHFALSHQPMPYQQQQLPTSTLTSPSSYSFAAPPSAINPTFAPFRQNNYYGIESSDNYTPGPNTFYPSTGGMRLSNFSSFQSTSPILSNPPTPPSARPTSSASTEIVSKSCRGRKRRRPPEEIRTPKLGNVVYNTLTDPFDREIYIALDMMVGWVEAAVDSGNEALFNKLSTMRTVSLHFDNDSSNATRVKRRRNVVKKPPGQEASEYEAFVEKLQNQLKLCPMPVLTYEQLSFIDTSIPHFSDITSLKEEIGQEFVKGDEIENYHLTFMPDYYSHVEQQTPFDQSSLFPDPMSKIYAGVNLNDLESSEDFADSHVTTNACAENSTAENVKKTDGSMVAVKSAEEPPDVASKVSQNVAEANPAVKESEVASKKIVKSVGSTDVNNYELFWRSITADEVGNCYVLPVLQKPNDDKSVFPIAPHRSVFKSQKKRHLDHRYAITLTIENMNLDEKVLKELQNLINNPEDLEIIEKTPPPESPQHANEPKEEPNEETAENVVEQMCRHCDDLVRHNKVAEFMAKLGVSVSDEEELNTFCSVPCYLSFMGETGTPVAPEVCKHASQFVDDSVVEQLVSSDTLVKRSDSLPAEQELNLNLSGTQNALTNQSRTLTSNLLSPIDAQFDPNYYSFNYSSSSHSNEQILRVSELPAVGQNNRNVLTPGEYKWKGFGWQIYDDQILQSFYKTQEDMHQKLATIQAQCAERNRSYRNDDIRFCAFCRGVGDGEQDVAGRLLNIDANEWVHVNCALWSTEVFENDNGVLKNVEVALRSAQTVQCKVCQRNGASLRCYKHNCDNSKSFYHLPCAKKVNGKFGIDKVFYCSNHEIRPEVCLERLGTMRRICIEREETPLLAKIFNHSYSVDMMMRIGSMIFRNIGQLLPEQVKNFHSEEHIYPVGYHITRLFWSPFNVREQTRFECTISDEEGQPMFHVQMADGQGKMFSDRTMAGTWNEIFQCVKRIRSKEMLQFYPDLMNASMLFGLQEPAITKITESLPGVDQMFTYTISHENSPLLDLPLAINPTGCARCEPRSRTLIKHRSRPLITQSPRKKMVTTNNEFTPDILSREARRTRSQRCLFTSVIGDENLAQMMRRSGITETMLMSSHVRYDNAAMHNAHSQYRNMKKEWRNYVYLGRSGIQGLGLYAKKDLDMNTIIIEYLGEMIRSELGEVREKKYLSQNRGIYMFRIDDEYIIDATMTGGLARYINHSCDPNCSTKILQYNDEKKIVIIANRPIKAGEELTYDYQFELEDDGEKIACLCGAPNCLRFMN